MQEGGTGAHQRGKPCENLTQDDTSTLFRFSFTTSRSDMLTGNNTYRLALPITAPADDASGSGSWRSVPTDCH